MRAAWIKWTEDQAYTSSMLLPAGTVPMMVPCLFVGCRNDPRFPGKIPHLLTGMAWGSILPQLTAFTAAWSGDERYAKRMAPSAGRYVALLQSYANNASYEFPELMNVTSNGDRCVCVCVCGGPWRGRRHHDIPSTLYRYNVPYT